MNYKVGDKVKVHTLEWFKKNANKDEEGDYQSTERTDDSFTRGMFKYCGKTLIIKEVCDGYYVSDDISTWFWEDWMLESPEIDISHDIVFISGSITNDKNYKQKFAALEQKLVSKGCIVLNPAVIPEGMEHDAYMPIYYAMIDQSETVVFMQDWRISDGAKMEMIHTIKKNKRIVFEEEI